MTSSVFINDQMKDNRGSVTVFEQSYAKEITAMAPEAPGNLVVIDLRFQHGELKGSVQGVEYDLQDTARIEKAGGWFHVLWNETPKGKDYIPVCGGVVYVKKDLPLGYEIKPRSPIELDTQNDGRLGYGCPALGEGLMLVLILPEGHTLADPRPMPRSAKVFKKKRLAVYWKPEGKYGADVKVTWKISPFTGDLRAERGRINADIDQSENAPDNPGVTVDLPPPRPLTPPQKWSWKRLVRTFLLIFGGIWALIEPLFAVFGGAGPLASLGVWRYVVLVVLALVLSILWELLGHRNEH